MTRTRSLSCALLLVLLARTALAVPVTERTDALVVSVTDGDTITVDRGTGPLTVRLIGVDTPETSRPDHPVEFYGPEAAEFTRRSLAGQRVTLEFEAPDRPGGGVDKYGRTLAYVHTPDGKNFNGELVRLGYGRVYALYPFRYQREFRQAERAARAAGLGIWNEQQRRVWMDPALRGRVVGNLRTHIYHLPGQDSYAKVREKNRIYFQTEEDAVKAGYRKARSAPAGQNGRTDHRQ